MLVKNKLKKLQAFDSSFFRSKILFEEDCTQNYLVFQSIRKYLKKISNTNNTSERRSKWFSDEVTKPCTSSDKSFAPTLIYVGNKKRVIVDESCLKQGKITYIHGKIVKLCIVYELKPNLNYFGYTFCFVKLTKNAQIGKYKCVVIHYHM